MNSIDIKSKFRNFALGSLLLLGACTPDDEELTLGPKVEADFTVEEIDGMRNTYLLKSTADEAFHFEWDLGDGSASFTGGQIDTAYYSEKGEYNVSLTALSSGGHSVSSREIVVENDAITGTNALTGGDMENEAAWNFTNTGSDQTAHVFENGALAFNNNDPAQSNVAMWQEVELKGGRAYKLNGELSGSGMTNSWMEVMLLAEQPEEGVDPQGTVFAGLNTWNGCGNDAFDNSLENISCLGDGNVNVAEDGTYYLVIKIGSWDGHLGAEGLTIDDLEFIAQTRLTEGDNILVGSDMETPSAWNIASMGATLTTLEYTDGKMKFTNGSVSAQTNIGVWQEVEVEAGQIYKMKADVNDPGSTGSWQEFYVSTTAPEDGTDYSSGRVYVGNTTSFAESGTVYVVIKVGSWDGNLAAEGVTIDNVELVEMN